MRLDNLEALAAVVLAGSLIMERVVAIVKTFFPQTFGAPGPAPEDIYREDVTRRRSPTVKGVSEEPAPVERTVPVDPAGKSNWQVYANFEARRINVVLLVSAASVGSSLLLSENGVVTYGLNLDIPWFMFALLISGGSAFWAQVVGLVGAMKDLRADQRREKVTAPSIVVVNKADPPSLD